jgi:hypothetical protein
METPNFAKQFVHEEPEDEQPYYQNNWPEDRYTTGELLMLAGMAVYSGLSILGFFVFIRFIVHNL